ncbi:MAG: hypothetical protein GC162_21065 [Planctomycetes bacterium]|nr:hypothetical protein [Planctomycetota bacterium]
MSNERKIILCPYCGHVNPGPAERCTGCGGFFDPLSRKVTQQHMGPWFIRDSDNPFRPGCTYEVLVKQIQRGKVTPNTILRGPTTKQFWSVARNVPGIANLLGFCHNCGERFDGQNVKSCPNCHSHFPMPNDRQKLGIDPEDPGVFIEVEKARAAEQAALAAAATPAPAKPVERPSMFMAPSGGPDVSTHAAPARARVIATTSTAVAPASASSGSSLPPLLSRDFGSSQPAAAAPAAGASASSADAMDWMTGRSTPDAINDAGGYEQAERSGNSMIWALVGMNVVLIIVFAGWVLLHQNEPDTNAPRPTPAPSTTPGSSSSTTTPAATTKTPAGSTTASTTTPPDDKPKHKPKPKPVEITDTTPVAPDPTPTPAPVSTPKPAPIAKPDKPITFFGIASDGNTSVDATPQQIAELNAMMNDAVALDAAGKYQLALDKLNEIKAKLPPGVKADGLNDSIQQVQEKLKRQQIENFLGK